MLIKFSKKFSDRVEVLVLKVSLASGVGYARAIKKLNDDIHGLFVYTDYRSDMGPSSIFVSVSKLFVGTVRQGGCLFGTHLLSFHEA